MDEPLIIDYFDNGGIKSIVPTFNGKIHGVIREYSKSGYIKEEYSVWRGMVHGPVRSYDFKGRLEFESNYFFGWCLKKIKHYSKKSGVSVNKSESKTTRIIYSKEMRKIVAIYRKLIIKNKDKI